VRDAAILCLKSIQMIKEYGIDAKKDIGSVYQMSGRDEQLKKRCCGTCLNKKRGFCLIAKWPVFDRSGSTCDEWKG